MRTHSATLSRFIVPCTILLAAGFAGSAHAEEYAKSYSVTGRANVHVDADDAMVRVVTSDDPEVTFDARYQEGDWWTPTPVITSRQNGNAVELMAKEDRHSWWSGWFFDAHRIVINVRMPNHADLWLRTSNGPIELAALNGHIWIHTDNGQINASQLAGTIDMRSSNGAIILGSLQGELAAHTSNGAIIATGVDGRCEISTSNGRVQVSGRFQSLNISSSNGGVVARAEPGSKVSSPWSIVTSNAGIDLSIPTGLQANLDVGTSNGRIDVALPVAVKEYQSKSQLNGALNGGGPELSLHTSNGGIRVAGI